MANRTIQEIEKTCLHRIEATISSEKDPTIQKQIEDVGRIICKCIAEQSTNPGVTYRVMNAAIRALPTYTTARPEKKKLI